MIEFRIVSKYKWAGLHLPSRQTKYSAGYDFEAAETVTIPPYLDNKLLKEKYDKLVFSMHPSAALDLHEVKDLLKKTDARPTLIPTGIKCYLPKNKFLMLAARSSLPLNGGLVLANSIGIIDLDYVDNESNEGEIFFQYINLNPFPVIIRKYERIGQGIIMPYYTVDNEETPEAIRTGGFGSTGGQ